MHPQDLREFPDEYIIEVAKELQEEFRTRIAFLRQKPGFSSSHPNPHDPKKPGIQDLFIQRQRAVA